MIRQVVLDPRRPQPQEVSARVAALQMAGSRITSIHSFMLPVSPHLRGNRARHNPAAF